MSQSELSAVPQIGEGASLASISRNDSLLRTTDLVSQRPPRVGHSSTPAVGVVVICMPRDNDWQVDDLAGRLAARLQGLDCAEAVRAISEQFSTKPRARAGDTRYACADDNRTLLSLLFTDIVGSTGMINRLGDGAWRALLAKHNAIVRAQLAVFGGHEVDNAGDGFFSIFGRPTRAVRCAESIRAELQALDIRIRAAIHTAECETGGESVSGVAVHVAARMVAVAQPGQIVVSNTVRELVAGSGLEFAGGKWHTLRGLSGRRQLYALK